jgi:hypothetical protein
MIFNLALKDHTSAVNEDIYSPKFCFKTAPELLDLIVQRKISRGDNYTGCSNANGVRSLFQGFPSPTHQTEGRAFCGQSLCDSLSYTASSSGNNSNLI